jgi:hypothetical protein
MFNASSPDERDAPRHSFTKLWTAQTNWNFPFTPVRPRSEERRQHQRPPRPRAPAPAPRPQPITPPAPHADPPLEPQAQRPYHSGY